MHTEVLVFLAPPIGFAIVDFGVIVIHRFLARIFGHPEGEFLLFSLLVGLARFTRFLLARTLLE